MDFKVGEGGGGGEIDWGSVSQLGQETCFLGKRLN